MRPTMIAIAMVIIGLLACGFGGRRAEAATMSLYVSPAGDDNWSGARRWANDAGTDGPLATIGAARDAVRDLKRDGGLPEGGVTVWISGGTYPLTETIELGSEDGGHEGARVRYIGMPGETARITGGLEIAPSAFQKVSDGDVLERLPEEAREHVRQVDLKGLGIEEYGSPKGGGLEMFFEGRRMTVARWPNEGFARITDILGIEPRDVRGTKGDSVGKFVFESDRLQSWAEEDDLWLHGYWFWDWSDERQAVKGVDPDENIIELEKPYHGYGYRKGQWFYAYNALCELDSPGEWYLDRERGILYFWPTRPIEEGHATVSVIGRLLRAQEASHVTLQRLTFEAARGTAVRIDGGTGNRVIGCTLRNLGAWAVRMYGGSDNGVRDCDIYNMGQGGIALRGGDRKSLTPANLFATNNHIHDIGEWKRMYVPGVSVHGVGNRVAHNLIHDGPHQAISFGGNEHVIEYNEIHSVCYESNDAGAMYSGRDWTQRGTDIRYNFLHHIVGRGGHGCVGVYLDDMFCGTGIHHNVFYRVYRAAFIGGGRDNAIVNNIFVDCPRAIHIDARAMNWASYHVDTTMTDRLKAMPYTEPPWSERYPQLLEILDDEPAAPKGNTVARNIVVGPFQWRDITATAARYVEPEQMFTDVAPDFEDPDRRDFSLPEGSPVYEQGFDPIPLDEIGLRETATRASWPVEDRVRPEVMDDWSRIQGSIAQRQRQRKEIVENRPTFEVSRTEADVAVDGNIAAEEWGGGAREEAMVIQQGIQAQETTPISLAWLAHTGDELIIAIENHVDASKPLRNGNEWGQDDAVEIAVQPGGEDGPILILRGYPSGHFESSDEARAPKERVERAAQGVAYAAKVVDGGQWNAEWRIPLESIGLDIGDRVAFNISVRKSAGPLWQMWQGTGGHTWDLHYGGFIELVK